MEQLKEADSQSLQLVHKIQEQKEELDLQAALKVEELQNISILHQQEKQELQNQIISLKMQIQAQSAELKTQKVKSSQSAQSESN